MITINDHGWVVKWVEVLQETVIIDSMSWGTEHKLGTKRFYHGAKFGPPCDMTSRYIMLKDPQLKR